MTSHVEPQMKHSRANSAILPASRTRRSCHMIPVIMLRSAAALAAIFMTGPSLVAQAPKGPMFEVDPHWPQIPNNWVLGETTSISVDSHDHIWVLHVPQSIPEAQRANAAPPVLEFDQAGKLLASWGGAATSDVWPGREHGIFVDA